MERSASLKDVERWRQEVERPSQDYEIVWGPISAQDAAKAGPAQGAASVAIRPRIAQHFARAAMQCVPSELLPRANDTVDTLVARVAASSFLDDAHVLNSGNGKRGATGKRKRLNETAYPQPRRKSWSVVVGPEEVANDGETVVSLFNYSAYGRLATDVRCDRMPLPVFSLAEQLWLAAMPYLCEESRKTPPTHCQLLLYYALLNSSIGRHRDNYTVRHFKAKLASHGSEEATHTNTCAGMALSQRLGSEVLLYSEGTCPMDFALSFPPLHNMSAGIRGYVKRNLFTVPLGAGTLFIFKDCDDQFFCHEAAFNEAMRKAHPTGYRAAFAFRWCTSVMRFKTRPTCSFHSVLPSVASRDE